MHRRKTGTGRIQYSCQELDNFAKSLWRKLLPFSLSFIPSFPTGIASLIGKSLTFLGLHFLETRISKLKKVGLCHCSHQIPLKQNNPSFSSPPSCFMRDLSVFVGKGRGPPLLLTVLLVMVCRAGLWSFPVASIYNCPTDPGLFTGKSRFRVDTGVTIKLQIQTTFANKHQQLDAITSILTNKTARGEEMGASSTSSSDYQLESFNV